MSEEIKNLFIAIAEAQDDVDEQALLQELKQKLESNGSKLIIQSLEPKVFQSNLLLKLLKSALKENKNITTIDLSYNQIGDEGAKAIADALKENKNITTINLASNQIGDEGAEAIAKALGKNKNITKINLNSNEIGYKGLKAIAKALGENKNITKINLSLNQIGDKGAKAIAEALEKNQNIREIRLSGNSIGDEGAKAIAKALETNQNIIKILFPDNQIGDEGAKAIAEALEKNQNIREIDLYSNQIGVKGAKAISKALEKNHNITEIDLYFNKIGDEGAKAIADALEKNRNIRRISLSCDEIGAEVEEVIKKVLKKNNQQAEKVAKELKVVFDKEEKPSLSLMRELLPRISAVADTLEERKKHSSRKMFTFIFEKYCEIKELPEKGLPVELFSKLLFEKGSSKSLEEMSLKAVQSEFVKKTKSFGDEFYLTNPRFLEVVIKDAEEKQKNQHSDGSGLEQTANKLKALGVSNLLEQQKGKEQGK